MICCQIAVGFYLLHGHCECYHCYKVIMLGGAMIMAEPVTRCRPKHAVYRSIVTRGQVLST